MGVGEYGPASVEWRRIHDKQRSDMKRRGSRAVGVALVLVAAVLWSTGGVGVKRLSGSPLAIAGWRGLFALPVLAGMVLVRARGARSAALAAPLRKPWAWIGAASYAVMVVCFVVATRRTTAANAIFIQYSAPAYVALLSWPLLHERVSRIDALACLGVLVGMVLFFREGLQTQAQVGNLVAVVSSLGAAGLPLALRADQRALIRSGELRAAAVSPALMIALGDLAAVVFCAPAMRSAPPLEASSWGLLAALGIGQIALPYILYGLAIPRLTALEGTVVPAIEPILNPVWVALGTGEKPGPLAMVGGGFVLGSVLLQAVAGRNRKEADAT
jgi:DME family drug/metabolite transporter